MFLFSLYSSFSDPEICHGETRGFVREKDIRHLQSRNVPSQNIAIIQDLRYSFKIGIDVFIEFICVTVYTETVG